MRLNAEHDWSHILDQAMIEEATTKAYGSKAIGDMKAHQLECQGKTLTALERIADALERIAGRQEL